MQEAGERMQGVGKSMQRMGCLLTGLITLPILGVIFAGPIGLVIGLAIGVLIFAGTIAQAKKEREKEKQE